MMKHLSVGRLIRAAIFASLCALAVPVNMLSAAAQDGISPSYVAAYLCADWNGHTGPGWETLLLPDGSPANFRNVGDCVAAIQHGQRVLTNLGGVVDDSTSALTWAGLVINSLGSVEELVVSRPPSGPCAIVTLYDDNWNALIVITPSPGEFISVPLSGLYFVLGPASSFEHALFFSNVNLTVTTCG